jgi:hypothetical protein
MRMNLRGTFVRSGFAALAVMLALAGCTVGAPSLKSPATPARFASELKFVVWSYGGIFQDWKELGSTPGPEPIQILPVYAWGLIPEKPTTFPQAITAAAEAQATGLGSSYWAPTSDADLVTLTQRLPRLRALLVWESPEVSDRGLAALKDLLGLRLLALQHCDGITDAGLLRLRDIQKLEGLELGYCRQISAEGLASLKGLRHLQHLTLQGDQIDDAALARIGDFEALQSLDLSWCEGITDAGMVHLTGLKALHTLNLAKTQIGDAGLVPLRDLKSLKSINLRACPQVTEAGVAELRKALPLAMIDH